MRKAHYIIQNLVAQGLTISVRDDTLVVDGPVGLLTQDLRTTLTQNKAGIIAALQINIPPPAMSWPQALEHFAQKGLKCELIERTAILEFDGGRPRQEAERQAIVEIAERHNIDF